MNLTAEHLIIMILTLIFVIGGGICAARSVKSAEGYSLGGRSAGVPLVAGSIAGTVVGGGATVGTAQMAYSMGLSAWWFTLGSGIAFILMGLFYAGRLRATGLETIPQYLKRNYGGNAAEAAGIISSLGILFSIVSSCLPGIQIVSAILNTGVTASAVILVALVASYVFFGGMKSAGVGGILKMLVIWLSLFAAGISAFSGLMSMPELPVLLPPEHWWNMFNIGVGGGISKLFSMIVGVVCTQTYIQSFFSASSPRVASIGAFAAAAIVIPVGLPSIAIGMYMHAVSPDVLPVLVLPVYLLEHQPVWLAGIALGGIMLSLVGSIGGLALGIGTMLTRDIIGRAVELGNGKKLLYTLRGVVLAVMASACLIAIINLDSQVLFWSFLSMSMRGCGVFLPLTFAIFCPRSIAKKWAFASIIVSTVVTIALGLLAELPVDPLYIGLAISAVMMFVGYEKRWQPARTDT
ncbi:sodium:solute symporter family protein [Anaerovibrio sp.]|uniref:sodium:solute symporter family protein n=1 Tax=Anaerovibrio sp. TaxID=1872532 RepID=UPI003F14B922